MTALIRNNVIRFVYHPAAVRLAIAVLSIAAAAVYPMAPVNGGGGV